MNAADLKQIMEATNKAIRESEQRMLQALHDMRGDIVAQMENSNQITVYVENKKDRMAETTEALRTFIRDHLHEADQATLLNMISVLKKKKR
jgi:cupin superfamily acireductone dioxygenase involved in methionine salvage